MRYLGLLIDSLREAMDSKVLYVTLALSLTLIVLVGSLHFRPATMAEEAEGICQRLNFKYSMEALGRPGKEPAKCRVQFVKQLNKTADPWRGDYQISLLLTLPATMPAEQQREATIDFLGTPQVMLWYLRELTSDQKSSKDGHEMVVTVSSRGTRINDAKNWPHVVSFLFGIFPFAYMWNGPMTAWVYQIQDLLVNTVGGWAIVLIGIIVTAGFVPSMMQPGAIDNLLVKPISRPALVIFKYLGGLSFVLVNSVVAIGGVWFVLGLRTGIWTWSFPLNILVLTAFFAIIYAVSVFFGVLTRNAILCIFMTCLVWLALFLIGNAHEQFHKTPVTQPGIESTNSNAALRNVVDTLHFYLPRTNDLGALTSQLLRQELLHKEDRRMREFEEEQPFTWAESLTVSGIFIIVLLGLACWRFAIQDY